MTKYQNFEEKRKSISVEVAKKQKIGGIFLALAVVFFLLGIKFNFLIIIGLILFIVTIVFFSQATKIRNTYRVIVKDNIIKELLSEMLDNVTYQPNNHLNINQINKTGLLRRPDRVSGEDRVVATYKGVGIESSDFILYERVERTDHNGNKVVTYEPYFKGRWIIYSFKRKFDEVLKIKEGRFSTRGLTKVSTESIVFNKKFSIYASSEHFAFYHITPSVLEKFLELEQMHRGSIMYCIMNNELHVGINDNRDYFELSLKKPITEESLKPIINEIDLMAAIINELKLDSPKYNN